jgi:catechol 2,3-dioxygenase-like lactoylglutathione lyase family enzyme
MTQETATKPTVITSAPFHPSLAVKDLAKSRGWYAEKLGWEPSLEPPGLAVYKVGGSFFTLYETQYAGTAQNTVMNWYVADMRAEMSRLRARGVVFEEYDFGEIKTVDGIMTDPGGDMDAWFKDPDGNTISVLSPSPESRARLQPPDITGMIAAADLGRAKAWYAEKLGFEPVFESDDVILIYRSGDTVFNVYKTQFAGTARNTVGVWRMPGIRDEVARLRGNGVVFEEYDFGDEGRTVGGIVSDAEGDQSAWFTDSEGNILALTEDRGEIA